MIKICSDCYVDTTFDPLLCLIVKKEKCQCHCGHKDLQAISKENAVLIGDAIWQQILLEIKKEGPCPSCKKR